MPSVGDKYECVDGDLSWHVRIVRITDMDIVAEVMAVD
jgi:hypothetical protein